MTKYGCIWNAIRLGIALVALGILIYEVGQDNPTALMLLGGLVATALIVGVFIMFMLINKGVGQQQLALLQANAGENREIMKAMSDTLKLSANQVRHAQQVAGYHQQGGSPEPDELPPAYLLPLPKAESVETQERTYAESNVVDGQVIQNGVIEFDTSKFQG